MTLASATPRTGMQRRWLDIPLWKRIALAMVAGIAAGLLLGADVVHLSWMGALFVRLTRMLVAPLVFVTIMSGVVAVGDAGRLGAVGARTLGLFVISASLAAVLGVALGLALQPGAGVSLQGATAQAIQPGRPISEQLLAIIPLNPVKAIADGDILPIVFFAITFAAAALSVGQRAKPVTDFIHAASDTMLALVRFVLELAPLGVFGLVAVAVGTNGARVFLQVSWLAMGTLVGSALLTLVLQPALILLLARLSPLVFLRKIISAALVAFSTSSSSASLAVEISIAQNELGLRKGIIAAVLPVGVTLARDGTAQYVALLAVFSAQLLGLTLTLQQLLLVVGLSTLLAVSTPPVPSASLFMLAAVLSAIGIGDEKAALIVGFVLPFDRLLDMIRTVPNVTANLANATMVAKWTGQIDVAVFQSVKAD